MARPKGPDKAMLAERGVTVSETGTGNYVFQCEACGRCWTVDRADGGRLPAGYWQCPTGCNTAASAARAPIPTAPAIPTDLDRLPAILTPAEAASLLRVSETTVKDWARAGELPGAFKLGKEWRVERAALVAYIRGA
jgi:excisionase family DNA binding protein